MRPQTLSVTLVNNKFRTFFNGNQGFAVQDVDWITIYHIIFCEARLTTIIQNQAIFRKGFYGTDLTGVETGSLFWHYVDRVDLDDVETILRSELNLRFSNAVTQNMLLNIPALTFTKDYANGILALKVKYNNKVFDYTWPTT